MPIRTYVRNLWAPYGVGGNSPAHGCNAVQEWAGIGCKRGAAEADLGNIQNGIENGFGPGFGSGIRMASAPAAVPALAPASGRASGQVSAPAPVQHPIFFVCKRT